MKLARRRYPSSGARRRTGWEEGPGGAQGQVIGASGKTVVGSGVAALADGLTIVRIRGIFQIGATGTPAAATDGIDGAFGICIVSNDAFAVGVTAIPGPVTDMQWDGWMYHRFVNSVATAWGSSADEYSFVDFEIDSKAMRKIGVNDTVCGVFEHTRHGAANAFQIWSDSRMLLKLP